ncbi:MAG: flagellar export chaperone FliS [Acidobacteriia bacterium]|nr:flagellar export chaperone FliS [Terriglobia bacterium]
MTNARTTYRENNVRGATAVRLVILLYEQLIQDLTQAAQAIEQNDIGLRTKLINHAILVIGHLQSPLDFDHGGKVAKDLEHFYNALRQNLVQVQFFPSKAGIQQLITDVLAVREAWLEVDQAENPSVAAAAGTAPSGPSDLEGEPVRVDWKG